MNRFNNQDTFNWANLLAQKVALDLDAGDKTSLKVLSSLLLELPSEMLTTAVRTYIGIDRCVQNELDERGPFRKVLERINQASLELDNHVETEDPDEA